VRLRDLMLAALVGIVKGRSRKGAPSVAEPEIRFDDGQAYERSMGVWSRLAGEIFLNWLCTSPGLRWLDVGCGSGAFTELIVQRCAPAEAQGIDPFEGQLAFANTRPGARLANFRRGDAMALPYPADSFDMAVMALVLFFVPEPAKGVAEMVRVVRPGGLVAAYLWDLNPERHPIVPIYAAMRAMGITPSLPPSMEVSRMDLLGDLWARAGLTAIESRTITVSRSYANFEDFWTVWAANPTLRPVIDKMTDADAEQLKSGVRSRLSADAVGAITCEATANAIKGRVLV
jgi:ubiquinone/menaquinone biosynthesis C-methylase UbiE